MHVFFIKADELLEKYNKIWNKVNNSVKKGSDSELVYKTKYLKIKIKSYEGKINTNFHEIGMPKKSFLRICLSVILIGSDFKLSKNYYS